MGKRTKQENLIRNRKLLIPCTILFTISNFENPKKAERQKEFIEDLQKTEEADLSKNNPFDWFLIKWNFSVERVTEGYLEKLNDFLKYLENLRDGEPIDYGILFPETPSAKKNIERIWKDAQNVTGATKNLREVARKYVPPLKLVCGSQPLFPPDFPESKFDSLYSKTFLAYSSQYKIIPSDSSMSQFLCFKCYSNSRKHSQYTDWDEIYYDDNSPQQCEKCGLKGIYVKNMFDVIPSVLHFENDLPRWYEWLKKYKEDRDSFKYLGVRRPRALAFFKETVNLNVLTFLKTVHTIPKFYRIDPLPKFCDVKWYCDRWSNDISLDCKYIGKQSHFVSREKKEALLTFLNNNTIPAVLKQLRSSNIGSLDHRKNSNPIYNICPCREVRKYIGKDKEWSNISLERYLKPKKEVGKVQDEEADKSWWNSETDLYGRYFHLAEDHWGPQNNIYCQTEVQIKKDQIPIEGRGWKWYPQKERITGTFYYEKEPPKELRKEFEATPDNCSASELERFANWKGSLIRDEIGKPFIKSEIIKDWACEKEWQTVEIKDPIREQNNIEIKREYAEKIMRQAFPKYIQTLMERYHFGSVDHDIFPHLVETLMELARTKIIGVELIKFDLPSIKEKRGLTASEKKKIKEWAWKSSKPLLSDFPTSKRKKWGETLEFEEGTYQKWARENLVHRYPAIYKTELKFKIEKRNYEIYHWDKESTILKEKFPFRRWKVISCSEFSPVYVKRIQLTYRDTPVRFFPPVRIPHGYVVLNLRIFSHLHIDIGYLSPDVLPILTSRIQELIKIGLLSINNPILEKYLIRTHYDEETKLESGYKIIRDRPTGRKKQIEKISLVTDKILYIESFPEKEKIEKILQYESFFDWKRLGRYLEKLNTGKCQHSLTKDHCSLCLGYSQEEVERKPKWFLSDNLQRLRKKNIVNVYEWRQKCSSCQTYGWKGKFEIIKLQPNIATEFYCPVWDIRLSIRFPCLWEMNGISPNIYCPCPRCRHRKELRRSLPIIFYLSGEGYSAPHISNLMDIPVDQIGHLTKSYLIVPITSIKEDKRIK